MCQASRSLPSHRRIKGQRHLPEAAKNPRLASEMAADATCQYGVNTAIILADVMIPLEAIGVRFRVEGEQPSHLNTQI
jgi:uroporphyrinogen-III decarboxylase